MDGLRFALDSRGLHRLKGEVSLRLMVGIGTDDDLPGFCQP